MQNVLFWSLGLLCFLLVITISIGLHEAGHMITAKKLKIPVPKFFIGFGPTIWSKKKGETEYGFKWIPLGGFILVEDTTQPEKSPERGLLSYIAPWKRILVFLAGPLVNIVLGVVIIFGLLMFSPYKTLSTNIETVNSCSSAPTNCQAVKSNIKPGDSIVKIDGKNLKHGQEIREMLKKDGSTITLKNDGKYRNVFVKPNNEGTLGVTLKIQDNYRSFGETADSIGFLFKMNVEQMAKIPGQIPDIIDAISGKEKRSPDSVSSVVGVGKTYGDTAVDNKIDNTQRIQTLIMYSGLLNIGLGFANLLPFLPLDGGRIFIAMIDSIKQKFSKLTKRKYSPLDYKWVSAMTAVTGSLVISFMLLVIVADIVAPVQIQ